MSFITVINCALSNLTSSKHNRSTGILVAVLINSAFLMGDRNSRRVEKTNHDRCNFRRSRPRAFVIYDREGDRRDLTENRFELNTRLRCILEAAGPRGAKAQLGLISGAVQYSGNFQPRGHRPPLRREHPNTETRAALSEAHRPMYSPTSHVIYLYLSRGMHPRYISQRIRRIEVKPRRASVYRADFCIRCEF